MKTLITTFLKSIFILLILLSSYFTFSQITIESTLDGGLWSDDDTWVGGSPPGVNDNVIINGLVVLDFNTSCNNFTVSVSGQFRNLGTGPLTFTIFGDASNYGIITSISYIFNVNIHGDMLNNGNWQNSHTYFVGSNPQNITTISPFSSTNFISNKPTGHISTSSPLQFTNSMVDFNGDTLYMSQGLDSIFLSSGHLQETIILAINSPQKLYFHQTNASWIEDVNFECDELVIDGSFRFSSSFEIVGDVRVEGVFRNNGFTQQSATIFGNLINNGSIVDLIYGWSLYISGDINHNGTWTNFFTYLSGDDDQYLLFTEVFAGENLINSNSNGKVISTSKLAFNNTIIDFNYDTLMFATMADSLIVNGQYLQNAVITKQSSKSAGFLNCTQQNNAYFQDVEILADNIDLGGTFQFNSPMSFFGNVTVSGILQNSANGNHEADIYGSLTNNGVIQDVFNTCILNVTGNLNQNGDWLNNQTWLTGQENQFINLLNNQEIIGTLYFDALNAGTPYQWYHEGGILNSPDFMGETSNTLIWQVPVGTYWYGEFYCETGIGQSRTITVEGGLIGDIIFFLEGPFNGTNMNSMLNTDGHIPLSQPYNSSPWNYSGTESVASIPTDIVDWVLAEFRETAGGPETATEGTMIAQQAMFLKNDGHLVRLDGSDNITINVPQINDNLYVVLWHRNHLPVMSANPLSVSGGIYIYDFTTSADRAYGDNQSNLGGVFGMIGGDANADGTINDNDGIEAWYLTAGQTGYYGGDVNMDTQVNNQDKNGVWYKNFGKTEILPE